MDNKKSVLNRRILLIDDTPTIHEDFKKILGSQKNTQESLDSLENELFGEEKKPVKTEEVLFEIDSAYQGQEGIEKVCQAIKNNQPYALAFVDVRMPPGLDGIETIRQIWEKDPELQVVICTAYSDYSWTDTVQKLGQNDRYLILKKPFDSVEVMQFAHAQTIKWNLIQENRQLISALERETKMVQLVQILNETLQNSSSVEEIYQSSIQLLPHYQEWILGYVFQRSTEENLHFKQASWVYCANEPKFSSFKNELSSYPHTWLQPIFETGETEIISRLDKLTSFPIHHLVQSNRIHSCVFLPIKNESQTEAVFEFYSDKEIEDSNEFKTFLSKISEQISRSIHRVHTTK